MSHAVFVNPYLVFVGGKPRTVGVYGFSLDEQGRRGELVVYLEVETMFSCRYFKCFGHAKLQFPIKHEIEVSFRLDVYGFSSIQHDGL